MPKIKPTDVYIPKGYLQAFGLRSLSNTEIQEGVSQVSQNNDTTFQC